MNTPDKELRRLVDGWYDGNLSPEDASRLEQRLLENADAKEYFLEMAELEAALPPAARAVIATPVRRKPWRRWLQMAAMFILGTGMGGWAWHQVATRPVPKSKGAGIAQARITGMLGVTWPQTGASHPVEFHQDADTASIESGLLELTFATGTRAIIEGPATFRVNGDNAMRLDHGKLVAEVPKGAEGFRVAYANGEIVDLGTEFALDVPLQPGTAHMGVFRGEIEYHPKGQKRVVKLIENHAVETTGGNVVTVPFDQSRFTRDIPSREFSWELKEPANRTRTWEYDVTHLIRKPGTYRVIAKWMNGLHGVLLEGAELFWNDTEITSDPHTGFAGFTTATSGNIYQFEVPPENYQRGRWTLRMKVRGESNLPDPLDSRGVLLVEDGLAIASTTADFIGTWEYLHDGKVFQRIFREDGSAEINIDGRSYQKFSKGSWDVTAGCLSLTVSFTEEGRAVIERHLLRNRDTLIFTNCPYRNAVRATH
ncbi:FecR family protein [Luteolibacter arcticus]|uniref:FecR family protein n=1 Tax=Luteolibacter arcticus TaxID=1581411 RepID=A0ABT3GNC4_9BACT|nr:FecR family protein [Luteolibacter arcticus]MCW1925021.1 FecR family protein [Luteolibacter arcticus]